MIKFYLLLSGDGIEFTGPQMSSKDCWEALPVRWCSLPWPGSSPKLGNEEESSPAKLPALSLHLFGESL